MTVTDVFLRAMLIVVWAIWAPLGFFLWVPLLIRSTLLFAGMVAHAAITGQDPSELKAHLEAAIDFWFAGFRMARDTVLGRGGSRRSRKEIRANIVIIEASWATAIWLSGTWLLAPGVFHSAGQFIDDVAGHNREGWVALGIVLASAFFAIGCAVGHRVPKPQPATLDSASPKPIDSPSPPPDSTI